MTGVIHLPAREAPAIKGGRDESPPRPDHQPEREASDVPDLARDLARLKL